MHNLFVLYEKVKNNCFAQKFKYTMFNFASRASSSLEYQEATIHNDEAIAEKEPHL